jgi:hypothetical protein
MAAKGEIALRTGDLGLRERDVPLLQFAAVVAAVGEQVALPVVLELEGLTAALWREASAAWRERMAAEPAVQRLYLEELALAEDRLGRAVKPLDDHFDAWLGLHALWRSHAEPALLLDELGLRAADMARLRRKWTARAAPSPKLTARIREAEAQPAASAKEPPPISLGETMLRPSAAAGLARAAAEAAAVESSGTFTTPADVLMMSLDEYARARAGLDEGDGVAAVVASFRLPDAAAWGRVDRAWRAELAREPQLAADFRALTSHFARARRRATPAAAPRPEPLRLPSRAIDVTDVLVPALLDEPVLPFAVKRGPVLILPIAHALEPAPDAGQTSDANPVLRDADVLPFEPPRPAAPSGSIDATAMALDAALLDLDELPFVAGGDARPAPAAPPAKRSYLTAAFPVFAPGAELTAEQYASLCAELRAASTSHDAAVLSRYGLTSARADALHREWQHRFDRDHDLRERWHAIYSAHCAYLATTQRGPTW